MKLAKTLSRLAVGLSAAAFIASSAPAMAKDLVMWERSGGNKDGRYAGRDVERQKSRPEDQPHLYPACRNGGEARPGHRVGRRARPHGHGPHLRAAVREGRAARRHHRQDRQTGRS